jgi:hypothetical protein
VYESLCDSVREKECVCVFERERVCVYVPKKVCVREKGLEKECVFHRTSER